MVCNFCSENMPLQNHIFLAPVIPLNTLDLVVYFHYFELEIHIFHNPQTTFSPLL
jgi:hypothetical protein